MPVKIPSSLPALKALEQENIFVMTERRALNQDIRPLRIAILNLMPNKEATETQLLRLLSNSPLQTEIVLLRTASYEAKNAAPQHLAAFYRTFEQVRGIKFDGLIITGAPVEKLEFSEVAYWNELQQIMSWARHNVYSTLYICWAAQAGLYYHYKIPKFPLERKSSGIFRHRTLCRGNVLVRGFDDYFFAPHSRYTEVRRADIEKVAALQILAESEQAGVYLCASTNLRHVFVTGHGEYNFDSLHDEYMRDKAKGMDIHIPENYYPNDDATATPLLLWRAHSALLFSNWLNYCVYQNTPYDINDIDDEDSPAE